MRNYKCLRSQDYQDITSQKLRVLVHLVSCEAQCGMPRLGGTVEFIYGHVDVNKQTIAGLYKTYCKTN